MDLEISAEFLNEALRSLSPEELVVYTDKFKESMMMYNGAIREVTTKLEVFNDEFEAKGKRNPIESIKSRIKEPSSIFDKLKRKGFDMSLSSMIANLNDIAGIRVICSFIDDIYSIADMLTAQDDIALIQRKDYIKNPKKNGYRSLHLVVEVPVFFSDKKQCMRVEVQIRTIAMDFWASLEHEIHYKKVDNAPESIIKELKECADVIFQTDIKMQNIHKRLKST